MSCNVARNILFLYSSSRLIRTVALSFCRSITGLIDQSIFLLFYCVSKLGAKFSDWWGI